MSDNELMLRRSLTNSSKPNYPKVQVTAVFPLDIVMELESISRKHNVRLSPIFRSLALRGLAAYHRDGLLVEPLENVPEQEQK